ncbi:MAG: L,D-transpeptidase [Opitutales bacterium]|jgi:lipoprotein-anchoring transpeptidase ErfK/SrfK
MIGEKILHLQDPSGGLKPYPFSYGKKPMSCREGSLGTPWGLHEVGAKIGSESPAGMIFRGRVPTGECWHQREDAGPSQENFVTTRILRLRGLESGLNAGPGIDSFDRCIYIHGTNHPEHFPENISSGCLLMLDGDLVRLFDTVGPGTHVYIHRDY